MKKDYNEPSEGHVSRLCQKTGCSKEKSREALSYGDGSLLSAVLYLEECGQIKAPIQGGYYSTKDQHPPEPLEEFVEVITEEPWSLRSFRLMLGQELVSNHLEFWHRDQFKFRVAVWLVLLLLPTTYGSLLPILMIPMFFGIRYRFSNESSFLAEFNPIITRVAKTLSNLPKIQKSEKK